MIIRTLLKISSSFVGLPIRFFPRNIKPMTRNLDELKEKETLSKKVLKPQEDDILTQADHAKVRRDLEAHYMASQYYPINGMPDFLVSLAQKVFSKYSTIHIRKWGYLLKQNYQRLSSCENPADITNVPLFANTDDKTGIKIVRDFKENYTRSVPLVEESTQTDTNLKEQNSTEQQLFNMEYKQAHAVAYLLKKSPHTYFVLMKILAELKKRCPEFVPLSCLDFGAGLGSGVMAAIHTFPKITKLAACEPSDSMRKLGKLVTKKLSQDVLWVDSLTMIPGTGGDRGKFNMVIISQVLQEVKNPAERISIIDALWSRVTDSKFFIKFIRWDANSSRDRIP